jgi:hypothetical protein
MATSENGSSNIVKSTYELEDWKIFIFNASIVNITFVPDSHGSIIEYKITASSYNSIVIGFTTEPLLIDSYSSNNMAGLLFRTIFINI